MATKANIVLHQGSAYVTSINMEDENDDVVSLAGYTGRSHIRKHFDSQTYYEFNVSLDEDQGIVTLSASGSYTNDMPHGRYVYDCELIDDLGVPTKILYGILEVYPGVTR